MALIAFLRTDCDCFRQALLQCDYHVALSLYVDNNCDFSSFTRMRNVACYLSNGDSELTNEVMKYYCLRTVHDIWCECGTCPGCWDWRELEFVDMIIDIFSSECDD